MSVLLFSKNGNNKQWYHNTIKQLNSPLLFDNHPELISPYEQLTLNPKLGYAYSHQDSGLGYQQSTTLEKNCGREESCRHHHCPLSSPQFILSQLSLGPPWLSPPPLWLPKPICLLLRIVLPPPRRTFL